MNKKRKINKKNLFLLGACFLAVWGIMGIYFLNHKTIDTQLKEIGYGKEEITKLKGLLTSENLKLLTQYQYHSKVLSISEEKSFQQEKLEEYLKYLFQYPSATSYDIVFLVNQGKEGVPYNQDISTILNHEDFKLENLDRYFKYYQQHELEGSKIVYDVNHDLDEEPKTEEKDPNPVEPNQPEEKNEDIKALFLGKKYMVSENMDRYIQYYQEHKDLSIHEIITRVNSNLDKKAYEDIQKADASKGNLILVNKYYYLDKQYVPSNLVNVESTYGRGQLNQEAYQAFIEMYNDASVLGLYPYIQSPYRSYNYQNTLYNNYVKKDGKKEADTYSARPGFSEHQTGLAMDLGTSKNHSIGAFENSEEFKWISQNAYRYGFILRYPEGKEYITGYQYEPWHYRYVGKEVAQYIYDNQITYEEYYEYFIK